MATASTEVTSAKPARKAREKKPSLGELFGNTTTEVVDGKKVEVDVPVDASPGLSALCEDYLKIYDKIAALAERLKEAKAAADKAESAILAKMDEQGCKTINTTLGYRFTKTEKPYYSLPAKEKIEDREKAVLWLKRVGAKELFDETIAQNTLTAFLRERIEEGKEVNPLISEFTKIGLSCVKDKKKG